MQPVWQVKQLGWSHSGSSSLQPGTFSNSLSWSRTALLYFCQCNAPIFFSHRQLWNLSSRQLKDCYCSFSEPRKNKPKKKEKPLPKQRLGSHWHKYHLNSCAQAASTHTGTWGPWMQDLKYTVTIFGHRWLWDTKSWWFTLREDCLLQSTDLEKDFRTIADFRTNNWTWLLSMMVGKKKQWAL